MLRNSRKIFTGNVISDKMSKTVTVEVNIYKKDLLYGKIVKKSRKFYVHDENEKAKKGNLISFMETRPLSKTKKFRLLKIIFNNVKEKK
ncbi:30S ribosomal protein S17 [Candidatus Phytoplasma pyri]|uniref:30S ribosomal protein S17 n=1 Tax=Candidatus Phytoplasma pyri TaxID=47566 RepID=UPI0039837A7D